MATPTDTTVLGRYYAFATTEEIETAVKELRFELDQRSRRESVADQVAATRAARLAEVQEDIAAIVGPK